MTVIDFDTGDNFTFVVESQLITGTAPPWHNTWEFTAIAPGVYADLEAAADKLAGFQVQLLINSCRVNSVRVSTWAADPIYGAAGFVSFTYNQTGAQGGAANMAPLDTTLFLRKKVLFGRNGRVCLRGSLQTTAFSSASGKRALNDPAGVQTVVDNALVVSALSAYVANVAGVLTLSMVSAAGSARAVQALEVGGVSIVKLDHVYYDVPPP